MRVSRVTPFLADLAGGKNLCFVKVETDGGPHGWGECYTQADRDTSIVALVEAIGRYLSGRARGDGLLARGERARAGAVAHRGQAARGAGTRAAGRAVAGAGAGLR